MLNKTLCLMAICLFLLSQAVSAEIKYVTDDLKLALHTHEGSKGKLLKRLQSGTKLDVLKESGLYAKVRTPDGTVGWTKAGFLMTNVPARAKVLELEQEQVQLKNELKSIRAQLSSRTKLAAELRAEKIQTALELAGQKENNENDDGLIAELMQKNSDLQDRIQSLENILPTEWSIPLRWTLVSTAVFLLLGLIAGFALFDWLSRKRHGGIRIY